MLIYFKNKPSEIKTVCKTINMVKLPNNNIVYYFKLFFLIKNK